MCPKIFLAEDDDEDSNSFIEAISRNFDCYEIQRVMDGLECIYALKNYSNPEIIFLDLQMPLKNGIDCLQVIRSIPELNEVPVIIYSNVHHMRDIDLAYKYGAAYYLVKPPTLDALATLLRRLFLQLREPNFMQVPKQNFVLRIVQKEV